MSDAGGSSGIYPFVRFTHFDVVGGNATVPLIGLGEHTPSYTIIEGIDLVDSDLTVNNQAVCTLTSPGPGAAIAPFFQAFVYDLSQAWFAWRGSLVVFPSAELSLTAFEGNWSYAIWGRVEPAFSLGP